MGSFGVLRVRIDLLSEPMISSEKGTQPAISTAKCELNVLANFETYDFFPACSMRDSPLTPKTIPM